MGQGGYIRSGARNVSLLFLTAVALLLVAPAPSFAGQLFAAPADIGDGDCSTVDDACDIEQAVESVAVSGDEVIVAPGDYALGAEGITIPPPVSNLSIHGTAGQARPVISSSARYALFGQFNSGISISDLEIEHTGNNPGLPDSGFSLFNGTVERVIVSSQADSACAMNSGTIRDSICRASDFDGVGFEEASVISGSVTMRNVTAFSTGNGSSANGVRVGAVAGTTLTLDAKNVIARGGSIAGDVAAFTDGSSTATATLANSNYDSQAEFNGGASVTDPGAGTNQTAAPVFVNAVAGDFHEAAGSPTINAGIADDLGTADLDGDARSQGSPAAIPDIGADEAEGDAPDTSFTETPQDPTNDTTPTFGFSSPDGGATFNCSLDSVPVACSDPASHTATALTDGSHTFEVAAEDGFFNEDATPASETFTVDTVPPDTSIDGGPSGATGDSTPTFTFSGLGSPASFECRVDGLVVPCSGPGSSHTTAVLPDGAHTFSVAGIDAATNQDPTAAARSFTVDTAEPNSAITALPPNRTHKRKARFSFSSSEPGSTFQCKLDRGAFRACTSPMVYRALGPRRHAFRVRAIDALGHVESSPSTDTWKVLGARGR